MVKRLQKRRSNPDPSLTMSQPEKKPDNKQRRLAPLGQAMFNGRTRMQCPSLKFITVHLAKLALAIAAAWPSAWRTEAVEAGLTKRAMHVLRDHCVRCHNTQKTKGDLNLTKRTLALKGGGEGPA